VGLGRVYGSEVANLQWQFRSNGLRIKALGSVKIDGTYDSRGRRKQREQDWSEPHKHEQYSNAENYRTDSEQISHFSDSNLHRRRAVARDMSGSVYR
jgi:hypothetical protein